MNQEQASLASGFNFSRDQAFFKNNDQLALATVSLEQPYLEAEGVINVAQTQTLASSSGNSKDVLEYKVQSGDTVSSIAERFGIDSQTVLWANDLSSGSTLKVGQKLTILPISGVLHLVRSGESVSYLSQLYETESQRISNFNELSDDNQIISGDLLIIPGGEKPAQPTVYSPLASGYFICPISDPCNMTQGLHWYNAVDLSNGVCGGPVFAAAGGTVQRTGVHNIAGRYVRIQHSNGVVTFYGHLSRAMVYAGQRVYQGQIVGYIGNSGYTLGPTGCHVHFDVRGSRNPFSY